MSKSRRSLCSLFSRTGAGLYIYHLLVWSNFNFLHISQWITLPTQSCLYLYSFCSNLLHSLIMWLMVSFLSPQSQHLLFCYVLSILALIWLVLTALLCAAIRRDSVSLLKFPFLSHVQDVYYYYYYLLIRVFNISVSWWYFTGDWVTASLLNFPGIFLVFWQFSIMLLFGWSQLCRQLPNPAVPLIII